MGLMDASTQTYKKLMDKYQQFMAPACEITIDGSTLPTGVAAEGVSVTLSLEAASTVNFRVVGAYKEKDSGFDSSVKSKLKLGAKVCVSLGYGSELIEVFQGFIFSVGASFGDSNVLTVTAMDVRRLMMEGTAREEKHVVTTYSAAFEEVMDRYSALCSKKTVTATDSDEIESIVQRVSDYQFVTETLCSRGNREFFILGDTAYFREAAENTSPCVELNWGEGLLSFSRNSLYQNLKITVLGFDAENKEAVSAEVTEKSEEALNAIGSANETVLVDADAKEVAKAKKRAEKEARKRKKEAQQGNGSAIGIPDIVPGRFITLGKLDSDLDGDYYINEVSHNFGADGYTTEFQIGGW